MKVHISILTSSDSDKAARCLASAMLQQNHSLDVSYSVIVNSTKGYYYSDVIIAIRKIDGAEDVPVISTESNGKPGKGKNEAFKWMYNNSDADYYMLLDGDDFLYPTALSVLYPLMEKGHDLITGLSQDMWIDGKLDKSWHDLQPNNAVDYNRDITEDSNIDLWKSYSIDRIYAIKREALTTLPHMREDLDLYEDFYFTVECTKLWKDDKLDYIRVNNSHIYGYDATGQSQCSIFVTDKKLAQWNMDKFESICKDEVPVLFSEVPFADLDNPKHFSVYEKTKFYNLINVDEANSWVK